MEDEKVEKVEVLTSVFDEKGLTFDITEKFIKDVAFPVKRMTGPIDLMYDFTTGTTSPMEASSQLFDTYDEMVRSVGRTDVIYVAYLHGNGKYRLRSGSIQGVKVIADQSCFMCCGNIEAWEALSYADEIRAASSEPDYIATEMSKTEKDLENLTET